MRLDGRNGYLDAEQLIEAARRRRGRRGPPRLRIPLGERRVRRAVQQAGLTWIGATARGHRAMGSKIESKRMMAAAGVPVLDELKPDAVTRATCPS